MRADGNLGKLRVERKGGDLQIIAPLLPVANFASRHLRQVLKILLRRHAAREDDAFRDDLSLARFAQSVVDLNRAGFQDLSHGLQNLFARRAYCVWVIERPLGLGPVEHDLRASVERTTSDKK